MSTAHAQELAQAAPQEPVETPDLPAPDTPPVDAGAVDAASVDAPPAPPAGQAAPATGGGESAGTGSAPGAPDTVGVDAPGQIDVSPASLVETVDGWIDGFVKLLPNIIVALLLLVVFYFVGVAVRRLFLAWARRRKRVNLGEVFGAFLKWVIVLLGILLALTIVVPTLRPGDLIAGLGVSSVAIGFAFKDILQNWLAGMLLLFRQPFEIGDQIIVEGYEGTVEGIKTRATYLRTYDGRRVIIPNADVYTNSVVVNTAFPERRSQYDVGIGYGDDIDRAREVMLEAMRGVREVAGDPAPDVLVRELADFSVVLRPRWWTHSRRADVMDVHSRVVRAIKLALDEAGIDMPYETQVHLLHDQSEAVDGRRGEQREGWPSTPDDPPSRFDVARG